MTKEEKIKAIEKAIALYREADVLTGYADEIFGFIGVEPVRTVHKSLTSGKTEVHVYSGFDTLVELFDANPGPRKWSDGSLDDDYAEFEALDTLIFRLKEGRPDNV